MIAASVKELTVNHHLLLRARSPSGWMLDSIDSPHGDQLDLMAAIRDKIDASISCAVICRSDFRREKGRLVRRQNASIGCR